MLCWGSSENGKMDSRTLKSLEYSRIKEILRGKCYSATGGEYVEELSPSSDRDRVAMLHRETSEFREIIKYEGGAALRRFQDIIPFLAQIEIEGSYIEGNFIIKIADTADISTRVCRSLSSKREKYPRIWSHASQLTDFRELLGEINRVLTPDGEVTDNASPALVKIRRQMESTRAKISDKLEKLISSSQYSDHLSDRLVTMRDGRYVVPVKDSSKSAVNGIVHDRSASGATIFMEPMSVLPLNNQLRELHSDEKREIERILISLCNSIREVQQELVIAQNILSILDFIHARAVLSDKLNGIAPEISEESVIKLTEARHPLLILDSTLEMKDIIPLDFTLGESGRALIITGPNTGGKTVALKTVGLFVLMFQSGIQLPAKYAKMGIFDEVFADIGDEQSIAMSLSTFSGHMKQISRAVDSAGSRSLVLLDELGSGTDPVEGAALGESIINRLVERGALLIVTTHLGALKTLAGENSEIRNGSMEFNRKELTPTYKFLPDIPGSSYALEVAEKLGMNSGVLKNARSLVDSGHRDLTQLVVQLEENLARVQKERDELAESRRAASNLEELYQEKMAKMKQWEKESDALALQKTDAALAEAQDEIERLIAGIKETKGREEAVKKARRVVQERRQVTKKKIQELTEKPREGIKTASPGDRVYINAMNAYAEVLSLPDVKGKLKVRAGNLVLEVKLADLSRVESPKEELKKSGVHYQEVEEVNPELDLRGLTFEEAEPKIERYLEDVYLAGVHEVRIIHGKGTGALRAKVSDYLRKHRLVNEMRLGNFNEGGAGVTVVKIKS
ncbi:MAG: endonuclease MutS2 [candidate division Zixibacteria bacterium]|nr:endonuclease MutS2 [candidate division Zixibacteria bacterium]